LLDRPEGTGTAATYGYRHLLQLLSIKIRQREGQSLEKIKEEMKDVTGDALERRIELHIREDSPAARDEAVIAMREAVRAALGRADIR
jgi:hypothetical protein